MDKELEQKFDKIDQRFEDLLLTVKDGFDDVSGRLDKVEESVKEVKKDVGILNTTVVTKSYLDDKIADLGSEIGKRINRAYQEQKLFSKKLIEFLKVDGVLKQEHVAELEEMLA